MRSHALAVVIVTGLLAAAACGDDGEPGDASPFELVVQPQFVQGAFPGQAVTVLVTVEDSTAGGGEVSLTASFPSGTAAVEPERIGPGEIAEVTLTADAVTEEREAELTITAKRGLVEQSATRAVAVIPGEDDRGPTARDILAIFTAWLAEAHPDLGITPDSAFDGSMVAPRLLVVSHYMFIDEQYELGLSWHVTIPPDDWSELYLRPRGELRPTRAFRMSSWTAGLAGEEVAFTEVAPPEAIMR